MNKRKSIIENINMLNCYLDILLFIFLKQHCKQASRVTITTNYSFFFFLLKFELNSSNLHNYTEIFIKENQNISEYKIVFL